MKDVLSHWLILFFKNFNILWVRHLIPLIFVIFYEVKDSVGKVCYPTNICYILRNWRFCWKDTLSHWHLLFLTIRRFYWKDTLPHWHLLFLTIWRFYWKYTLSHWCLLLLKNLKVLLEIYLLPLTFIISQEFEDRVGKISYPKDICCFLRNWRFCRKDNVSYGYLLFLRIWRFCWKCTLSHRLLLVFKNLKIFLERCLMPLTYITF